MEEARLRFFKKVNKTDTCWLWTGCKDKAGYGWFGINHKNIRSHRFSWLLAGNIIPEGHLIRHKCLNKDCVNPVHLETGTQSDNMKDRVRDGTVPNQQGELSNSHKLTEDQVRAIRANPENKSGYRLAKDYNVSDDTIYDIIARKTWKHI